MTNQRQSKATPSVNAVGRELESLGLVNFGRNAYNQINNNCYEIASYLAEKFGYKHPLSKKELTELIFEDRARQLWDRNKKKIGSAANLVVRTTENPNDVHVSFELFGREYNYGPATKEGFTIDTRIPLFC